MSAVMKQHLLLLLIPSVIQGANRIIGGTQETITNTPYQLSLRRYSHHICGATILSSKVGITAAHCLQLQGAYSVKAGITNLDEAGVVIHVNVALVHPYFSKSSTDYDIALLFLASPLPFSDKIKPVRLPGMGYKDQIREGMIGKISGWGTTKSSDKDSYSNTLYSVEVPVISWEKCNNIYFNRITERMFCAGLEDGGKDSCAGDSGGPFVVDGVLYGIVSGGVDCAQPGYPGIYTNVQVLRQFIEDNARL